MSDRMQCFSVEQCPNNHTVFIGLFPHRIMTHIYLIYLRESENYRNRSTQLNIGVTVCENLLVKTN